MERKNILALIAIICSAPTLSQAGCPTLTSKEFSAYLCSSTGIVKEPSAIIYQGPTQSWGTWLKSWCTKGPVSQEKYEGTEFKKKPGKLVCHYNLPEAWKSQSGISEFSLEATVDEPTFIRNTVCPPLDFNEMTTAMCNASLKGLGGVTWTMKTNATAAGKACSIFKGLVAKIKEEPKGKITGHIDDGQFVPFSHECHYTYQHEGPQTLILNGKLDLDLLKRENEAVNKKVHP